MDGHRYSTLDVRVRAVEAVRNGMSVSQTATAFGDGSFTIGVSSIDTSTKAITVNGFMPYGAGQVTRTIKVKASIGQAVISFRYGIQVLQIQRYIHCFIHPKSNTLCSFEWSIN